MVLEPINRSMVEEFLLDNFHVLFDILLRLAMCDSAVDFYPDSIKLEVKTTFCLICSGFTKNLKH